MRCHKRFLLLFGITLLAWQCGHEDEQTRAIKAAARAELRRYPQASLLDLYKFFFQGAYGPGHMIPNAEMAQQYLDDELRMTASFDTVHWQPVGHQGKFYRINLSLVHDNSISAQTLLAAFIESANTSAPPSLEEWRAEWQSILEIITSMSLNLADFENDQNAIAQQLAEGKVIGHHSEKFERLYHPHYRVVDKAHFEILFKQHK